MDEFKEKSVQETPSDADYKTWEDTLKNNGGIP